MLNPLIAPLVPSRLAPWLRTVRRRLRHQWRQAFFAFGPAELSGLLREMGVMPGDVVMVHSSFDDFDGFQGSLRDVMELLQDAVGEQGGLLMPTLPFTGNAVDYARAGAVFDVRRTPSRMGFITEIFRRLPGVTRSVHPTHPVAGWGARSASLLAGHQSARTPCGAGSPFAKLADVDGKIVFLGAGVRAMTFFHYLEEALEARMPFSPFTSEMFTLSARDEHGETWPVVTRLYDPVVSRARDVRVMVPYLRAGGFWHERRLGMLDVIVLRCREVERVVSEMATSGVFCYRDTPRLVSRQASTQPITQLQT